MNKEIKTMLRKTAKIAAVTCIAAGAVALMTSATAIKALTEGARYLKDTLKRIIDEEPGAEAPTAGAAAGSAEEAPAADAAAEEADFAEPEPQEA